MNWQELSTTSHYQTAVAVEQRLRHGDVQEAAKGLEELIDALARSEKRALKSQLARLMLHVLKWKLQPEKRTRSWLASIHNARQEIADIQEETASLTRSVIDRMWDKCLLTAKRDAEGEMDTQLPDVTLSWEQVFETEYGEE